MIHTSTSTFAQHTFDHIVANCVFMLVAGYVDTWKNYSVNLFAFWDELMKISHESNLIIFNTSKIPEMHSYVYVY